ncbi:response regulator transcription factor [Paenibacillus sp.]|jgi:DNA-binding NarL/FixJ family response regulator|uniref:response regulator transcription factor n=1 Tax=Paenibacillus sp. TaxID=58172 RepID=UPI00282C8D6F|nr:response regulator transcription factor [Paenibacillus sp.]MDR0268817.1 response regulator transcription factor [Paenibacillus sp.]
MQPERIRVMIADDQPLIRNGLGFIIKVQKDMEWCGEVGNGHDAVTLALKERPHIVLMDVQMPELDGIDATRELKRLLPDCKVIILTTFDLEEYVYEGIRAGAVGYLLKDAEPEELLSSIRAARRGEAIYHTTAAAKMISEALYQSAPQKMPQNNPANLPDPLTDRELEVLQEMAFGLKNEDIAAKLHISESTVKTHVHRILQKIGAEDRTQAVVLAIRSGWVK